MPTYIYERKDWPLFRWDDESILNLLGSVRHSQGKIMGRMEALGFDLRNEATLETNTIDVLKTSEIEGENLNREQVRSSLARRLGMDIAGLVPSDRHVDGVVEMLLDAIGNNESPLDEERLFGWHNSLFPGGRSGISRILVGEWRRDIKGRMQVVSGVIGRETIHYIAPKATIVPAEMKQFIKWFNAEITMDPVIKAAISHFWFITIHPFEDGNGRIARAITDLVLGRGDGIKQRFYSMSARIRTERKGYYQVLEKTQKGDLDITEWMVWFLRCLLNALVEAEEILAVVMKKNAFWKDKRGVSMNVRQVKVVNKLLDGFEGKLTTIKWSRISKCSRDTALRDINDLIGKGVLQKGEGGGRNASYDLVW